MTEPLSPGKGYLYRQRAVFLPVQFTVQRHRPLALTLNQEVTEDSPPAGLTATSRASTPGQG